MKLKIYKQDLISIIAVSLSALLQTLVIKGLMSPAHLLSSGFTGTAILLNKLLDQINISISVSIIVLLLNVPVALLCFKTIGKKFVVYSTLQVMLLSFFLRVIYIPNIYMDTFLNTLFGGFLYGLSVTIALKGNASTGGTDFLALYISNKFNQSIFRYILIYNALLLMVYGYFFGWIHAGYSIIFQLISTLIIDHLYNYYKCVTLQITTNKALEIAQKYTQYYRHGLFIFKGEGGYHHQPYSIINTVISYEETESIIRLVKSCDPQAIINIIPTLKFVGHFYRKPLA